jgi:hippurate hydrolase
MWNHPRRLAILATTACITLGPQATAQPSAETAREIRAAVDREYESLDSLYTHLHANPELSFHEENTSGLLAELMRGLGFEVTERVGGFGVVCVLRNGTGPTVMVRTDTDALPVTEQTGRPYASKVVTKNDAGIDTGVMHACGHDIHMTCWAGTARLLSTMKDRWSGTLVMIAQPAEERGAGAKAMLEDGLFSRFPRPDYAIALHVDPQIQAGMVSYTPGYAMANVDSVDITIRGIGGHGAYPHMTKDPIAIGAQIVVALQMIVSREVKPIEPAVVTVGSFHSGTKHNIISNEAKLQLTVRTYSDEVRAQVLAAIARITKGIAVAAGLPDDLLPIVEVDEAEFTPATYNDPELVARTIAVMARMLGEENVVEEEPVMGGEDFSRYGRQAPRIPIFMFNVGTISAERIAASQARGGTALPSLHSSLYWPDRELSIRTGVKAMTAAALDLFGSN